MPGIVIGLILMFGGFWFSKNVHIGFLETLSEQGLPIDLGKTVSTIGVFLILFPVVKMFFISPLTEAIDARNAELEKTFGEAESLRAQMTAMKTEYEQRLARTEAEAREQIQAQIREAQEVRQQLMAEASLKADELVKRAQEDIQAERDRVINELRIETVNLTLAAAERVIGENLDDARNRKLIEDFIATAEVPT